MTTEEKLKDIKEHPENHQHDFGGLERCCMTDEGAYSALLMEAHRGTVPQRNPGGCDVRSGPCSCGAWH
jgi:hypothetical protein